MNDATQQAGIAQTDVAMALTALSAANVTRQQINQALMYLQQASQAENKAYQDLQQAGQLAGKINPSLAMMLNQQAFNLSGVAGAFSREQQTAQQQPNQYSKNPQAGAQLLMMYIDQTSPTNFSGFAQLANEGVQYTGAAAAATSTYH